VGGADAVRLFVERARSALPFFVLSPESAPSISQICRALDGIPLGLELAAAWVGVISVDQIAARLNSALRLLTTGGRARPSRHQTIGAAIEWSYALLPAAEQTFFQRLSVFVGGWSLEAAEDVVAGDSIENTDALDLLRRLVEKSLVVAQPRPDGSMRYKLLEILRQYAQERLEESGSAETVRSRCAEYFVTFGEQAEPNLKGCPQVKAWLDRLDQEEGNLRAVLRWYSERLHIDQGLRLGGAVWRYWHLHGSLEEGRNWLNLLLGMAGGASPRDGHRAKVLNAAGVLATDQEDFATAQSLLDESCAIGRELGDHARVVACLHNLGVVAWLGRGDYAEAERLYVESLNLARNHGMRAAEASDLNVLGLLFAEKGDFQRAHELSTECVGVFRELGDELNALLSQLNLAWVSLQEGDLVAARELYADTLSHLKDNNPADGIPECLEGLAAVAARETGVERAVRLAAASAHLREIIGRPPNRFQRKRIDSWFQVLRPAIAQGPGLAARCLGETMSLAEAIEYALSDIDSASSTSRVGVSKKAFASATLTRREQEVAALLAKGRSNRQIAESLVIANSTAERHVANILSKLGLGSRLEVGLWAVQNGLT
jgi:non-specific serine/threonine protein kinase